MLGNSLRKAEAVIGGVALACQLACGEPSEGVTTAQHSPVRPAPPMVVIPEDDPADLFGAAGAPAIIPTPSAASGAHNDAPRAGAPSVPQTPQTPVSTTSYHRDIRPVMERSCTSCHSSDTAGTLALDTWTAVRSAADAIVNTVTSGSMPPWPANDACHALRDSRALPDTTRDVFSRWRDEGFPEGSANEYRPTGKAAATPRGRASLTLDGGPAYTPRTDIDDYRCFITEHVFYRDTYITAVDILPEQLSEVHDVEVHRLTPEQREQLSVFDLISSASGYNCTLGITVTPDGTAFTETQPLFSWRPGTETLAFDEGDAVYIPSGSSLMIKVHYVATAQPDGSEPPPDRTLVQLWTLPEDKLPEHIVYRQTVSAPFLLPAGSTRFVVENNIDLNTLATLGPTGRFVPGEIIGITPQANRMATEMAARLIKGGGAGEACLVDIPKWRVSSQLDYVFEKGVNYSPDDRVQAVCVYDNGPDNQPEVDGVRQEPKGILSGQRARDELCTHYVWLRMDRKRFLGLVAD